MANRWRTLGVVLAVIAGIAGLALAGFAGAQRAQTARQLAYPKPTCDKPTQILDTKITKHPKKHTSSNSAKFEFKAFYCNFPTSGATKPKFACNLDGKGFDPCDTPKHYSGLKKGKHKFKVKVTHDKYVDSGDPTPAHFAWKIH